MRIAAWKGDMTPPPYGRRRRRWSLVLTALVLVLIIVGVALAWHSAIAPIARPQAGSFDEATVQRGAQLAAIGNCAGCHTVANGGSYAGGLAMSTPFGTMYSTNITPDAETGIGTWSQAAFTRAMREGVARDGHQLYPAFPYDHFTRLADGDIAALYAYFMTREPVHQTTPANALMFPFGFRPLVAGWNLLFLDKSPFHADPSQSAEWNRGAYLADALAHCSACHSPRNALGAERQRDYLAGGEAEGWYVSALNRDSPSPQTWTVDALTTYLRTGIAPNHAIAAGPMQWVTATLGQADEKEVRAIATYIQSVQGAPNTEQQARASASLQRAQAATLREAKPAQPEPQDKRQLQLGAAVYENACARCHDVGREISSGGALRLPLAVAVYDPDPRSLIRIIREGVSPPPGQPGRYMPGFASMLTDEQLTALVVYLRRQAADAPPWPDVPDALQKASSP